MPPFGTPVEEIVGGRAALLAWLGTGRAMGCKAQEKEVERRSGEQKKSIGGGPEPPLWGEGLDEPTNEDRTWTKGANKDGARSGA